MTRLSRNSLLLAVICILASTACASRSAQVSLARLNAVDDLDSHAYDALLAAQAALDQAKASFKAGKLPANCKGLINSAGAAYDATRASWLIYRDIRKSGKPVDGLALVSNLRGLESAIAEIFKFAGVKP